MGDFFGGLRSGIQFPQVVMNQGPLPGAGGLPQPLHETADARINYGSSLLGDLSPYAYGEPGYLSSQNAYLNIPHKIQKIVPVVFLPEARRPAREIIDVSHPIDDGDIAFVLRLDRNSMFCTGLKSSAMKRAGLGTAIDPFINLCTLNYVLSGLQLAVTNAGDNLWTELAGNLDKPRFGRQGGAGRDYDADPINLGDVVHVIRHCIRPFGVTRGSEKQGGQSEATLSPATWPVSFVVSLTIDGKESNVLNVWHHHELHAGNDLVLRLKPMPIRPYTLNHYYKGVKRQSWDETFLAASRARYVWQLVPDLLSLNEPDRREREHLAAAFRAMPAPLLRYTLHPGFEPVEAEVGIRRIQPDTNAWQELGYWHIGRSQIQTGKYGTEEYWHNDLANSLRTNHLDITFQPVFQAFPIMFAQNPPRRHVRRMQARPDPPALALPRWEPSLALERLPPAAPVVVAQEEEEPDWLGRLEFADEPAPPAPPPPPPPEEPAKKRQTTAASKRRPPIGGSLLKADGTSEPSMVGML
jgi:hypothetical protein